VLTLYLCCGVHDLPRPWEPSREEAAYAPYYRIDILASWINVSEKSTRLDLPTAENLFQKFITEMNVSGSLIKTRELRDVFVTLDRVRIKSINREDKYRTVILVGDTNIYFCMAAGLFSILLDAHWNECEVRLVYAHSHQRVIVGASLSDPSLTPSGSTAPTLAEKMGRLTAFLSAVSTVAKNIDDDPPSIEPGGTWALSSSEEDNDDNDDRIEC
jgi:hypothetical protein